MSLVHYSPTDDDDDDEDYTSSDTDHLFMKTSPRRQSTGTSTTSPPRSTHLLPQSQQSARPSIRSTPLCTCRKPSSDTTASTSAAAYSPVEPAIWNELRRLFNAKDPRKQFDIQPRSTFVKDESGKGFVLVEARVQAKDGSMVAKGELCTDHVLSLRNLRNALMETKGPRYLPLGEGEEIVAARIVEFEKVCSACGLPRYFQVGARCFE